MDEVFNVGKTILLDGQPLSLVTPAGVEAWIDQGIKYSYRYDQVRDPLDSQMKYRCIYEQEGAAVPFVLWRDPCSGRREMREGSTFSPPQGRLARPWRRTV